MKTTGLTFVCLTVFGFALICTSACADQPNLINNPGFEKQDEYDASLPRGWYRLQCRANNMFVDKSTPRSGKASMCIISDPKEGTAWGTKWVFNLDKGRQYKFSLYTKWNGVEEGCSVRIHAAPYPMRWGIGRKGKLLFEKVYKNKEWQRHEATLSMPADMNVLAIYVNPAPGKKPNNRIWIDDVSLQALGKAPTTPAKTTKPRVYRKRPKIEIDKTSHALLLDGKLFLPIGIAHPTDKAGVKAVKAQGFNTVWLVQNSVYLLDDVYDAGMFAFIDFSLLTDMREWDEIRRQVSVYKNNPAVLGWHPKDEPNQKALAPARKACEIIRKADPSRPIIINAANPRTFSALAKMTDVLMSCAYPVKTRSARLTQDTDWMDQAIEAVNNKKPVWWWIQAYEWKGDRRILPTVAQERCMTYMTLIHNVKGFCYFSYPQMKRKEKPALWNSFKGLNAELKQLAPVILAVTPKQEIKVTPKGSRHFLMKEDKGTPLHYLLKQHKGKTYVFAANPTNKRVEATFTLPKLKRDFKLSVLFEKSKSPKVTGNSFSDVFEGYGVHVYVIGG